MFHGACWQTQQSTVFNNTAGYEHCPNCRGNGRLVAIWNYRSPGELTQPGAPNLLGTESLQADSTRENEAFHAQTEALDEEHEAAVSHAATEEFNISTPREVTDFHSAHGSRHPSVEPEARAPWPGTQALANFSASLSESLQAVRRPSSAQSEPLHRSDPRSFPVFPNTMQDYWEWDQNNPEYDQDRFRGDVPKPKEGQLPNSTFHSETRLQDGRPSLLIDPGSLGNLAGDQWARDAASVCLKSGGTSRTPSEYKRSRPLTVSGVGKGSQAATYNVRMPYACKTIGGKAFVEGTYEAPCVSDSALPALLGLSTMKKRRTILDLVTNQMHFCGPGDIRLNLPEGTESFQLEEAPSGHLVLPINYYKEADSYEDHGDLEPKLAKRMKVLLATSGTAENASASPSSV